MGRCVGWGGCEGWGGVWDEGWEVCGVGGVRGGEVCGVGGCEGGGEVCGVGEVGLLIASAWYSLGMGIPILGV